MLRALVISAFVSGTIAASADAQERKRLGYGRLITNDLIGDGEDRWRTGSVASSRVWGPEWTGIAPTSFGDLLELRLHGEIIAPVSLRNFDADDRRYAGALSLGLHTHVQRGAMQYTMGGDLVVIGPQTGLDSFQRELHDVFGITKPSDAVLGNQIDNAFRPTFVFEAGRILNSGPNSTVRPFVEARAGAETLARIGVDWTYGGLGQGELLVRDPVAGQRYRVIEEAWSGFSFTLGADIGHVEHSEFLPDDRGPALEETRGRVRAGLMWQSESGMSSYAGVTYLSEEFDGQDEGQFVGSVRVNFGF
ncbi:MAG: lipid A-modifier LpxR family protein [Pseudomonadota bacterium]